MLKYGALIGTGGVAWVGAIVVAALARALFGVEMSMSCGFAAVVVVAALLVGRLEKNLGMGLRAYAVAALSSLGAAGVAWAAASSALDEPIVSDPPKCGLGVMAFIIVAPFALFFLGATSSAIAIAFAKERPAVDRAVRLSKWAAIALVAPLVVVASARALRRPSVDRWSIAANVVAEAGPVEGAPTGMAPPIHSGEAQRPFYDVALGPFTLRRTCDVTPVEEGGPRCDARLLTKNAREVAYKTYAASDRFDLRHDVASDLWILGASSSPSIVTIVRADSNGDDAIETFPLMPRDIARGASAPTGYVIGGAIGLLVAVALRFVRRREGKKMLEVAAAQSGTLEASGWITFDGGAASVRAPPDAGLAPGPVVVFAAGATAYRGDANAQVTRIEAGDKLELLADARARLAAIDAFALAAVVSLAAPLAAAAARGLVF